MSTNTALAFVIRRTFQASAEEVFEAFTDPLMMKNWMGAQPQACKEVAVDLQPGGSFAITMYGRDGEELVAGGTYREIVPPHRLVSTWSWLGDHPAAGVETLLTVEFNAQGDRTEVVLTQERFVEAASRDLHEWGWGVALDKLAARLTP